ncbi:MAG TPA: hypothetical protein VK543_16635 [Puia sp.]|nr:hypothetical protein [Puia sp.]
MIVKPTGPDTGSYVKMGHFYIKTHIAIEKHLEFINRYATIPQRVPLERNEYEKNHQTIYPCNERF